MSVATGLEIVEEGVAEELLGVSEVAEMDLDGDETIACTPADLVLENEGGT